MAPDESNPIGMQDIMREEFFGFSYFDKDRLLLGFITSCCNTLTNSEWMVMWCLEVIRNSVILML